MPEGTFQKPDEWAFNKGLVDPIWNWWWDIVIFACPFWTQGFRTEWGMSEIDLVTSLYLETALDGDPPVGYITTSQGVALRLNANDALSFSSPAETIPATQFDMTLEYIGANPSVGLRTGIGWGQAANTTDRYSIGFDGNTDVAAFGRITAASANTNASSTETFLNPLEAVHMIGIERNSASAEIWVNGALVGTDTTDKVSKAEFTRLGFGEFVDSSPDDRGGERILMNAALSRALTPVEIAMRSADPWGPFRMADEIAVLGVAAAPPTGNPLASSLMLSGVGF